MSAATMPPACSTCGQCFCTCNDVATLVQESEANLPDAYVTVYEHVGTPTTFGGAYSSEKNAQGMARTGGGRAVRYVPLARVELATRLAMLDEARERVVSPLASDDGNAVLSFDPSKR